MIVQEVCLPEGSKMLVIPIFFPIIPFIFYGFSPQGLQDSQSSLTNVGTSFNPGSSPTFSFFRSTGDKQTSKGLFLFDRGLQDLFGFLGFQTSPNR
jgi:hypothetical protein